MVAATTVDLPEVLDVPDVLDRVVRTGDRRELPTMSPADDSVASDD